MERTSEQAPVHAAPRWHLTSKVRFNGEGAGAMRASETNAGQIRSANDPHRMAVNETVTQLLIELSEGESAAMDRLLPVVYDELRRLAHRQLDRERADHTFSTTDLVHEAFLKLVQLDRIQWQNRAHFFAIAAQAMRNILVNYALKRKAQKRGGAQEKLPLDEGLVMSDQRADALLALDEALTRLEAMSVRQHQVVTYRFFGGLNIEETATVLKVSPATVKREWTIARAWLNRELQMES
ncbi:MAG: ECF-type sigma factor [Rhodothermales bacterium]